MMMETRGYLVTSWRRRPYAPHDEKKSVLIFALIIWWNHPFFAPEKYQPCQ